MELLPPPFFSMQVSLPKKQGADTQKKANSIGVEVTDLETKDITTYLAIRAAARALGPSGTKDIFNITYT